MATPTARGRSSSPLPFRPCLSIQSRSACSAGRNGGSRRTCSCFATICRRSPGTCARRLRSAKCSTRSWLASTAASAPCGARRSSMDACCARAAWPSTKSRIGAGRGSLRTIKATFANRPTALPNPGPPGPELGRRGADRLPAGRPSARWLHPQPRRAEGPEGSLGIDRPRHSHRDQARSEGTSGRRFDH